MMFKPSITALIFCFTLLNSSIRSEETPPAENPEEPVTSEEATPEDDENKEPEPNCNQALLNSVGLLGLSNSKEMQMDICSSVKDSCCQLKDQLAIFDYMLASKEMENLAGRLAYHSKVTSIFELYNVM